MRASVVVNNCDYERYVGVAIDSALAQTHPDVEVVVVDDGSTDGSRRVIAGYGDRVVALLKPNGGQTSALNAAMGHCTGDVVVFLDADDTLAPAAVERAVGLFAADPGIVKVHWPLAEVGPDGRPLGGLTPRAPLPRGDLRDALLAGGPEACAFPPTSGNAFAAAFLREELPLPEAPTEIGSSSADAYLSMLAVLRGRIGALDEPLGSYRIHGANGFAARPLAERIAHNVVQLDHRCDVLAERCRRLGLPADPDGWRRRSWLHRLDAVRRRLDAVLGDGETYVLVDQDEWGAGLLPARRALPFLERDGRWFGPPPDDATAVAELERLRGDGARHAVFGWPAFWWLEHYRGLTAHLETRYRRVACDEDLVVYDLTGAGT